jgi:Cyclic nucleotide-binding domain
MPPDAAAVGYLIWGVDRAIYGPVELPTLVEWIKDERIVADTWLFLERASSWEQAAHVPELQMFFHGSHSAGSDPAAATPGRLSPGGLRHIRLLAGLNDEQVDRLLQLVEVQSVPAGTQVAKLGEPAQAMFLLLEGELRVRAKVDGVETSLGNLNAGEFFGEIALFDQGPRSTDVIAV